jgi:hypothetical protein
VPVNFLMIKSTAQLGARHFDPECCPLYVVVLEKSPKTIDGLVWITSGVDSHETGLHPNYRAWDIRTKNIEADSLQERRDTAADWAARIGKRLGVAWQVFHETFADPDKDHIHAERDPLGVAS